MKYNYPEIRKSDLVEDHFGYRLPCPYTWLRNTDDPEVKDFTARENAYTDAYFDQDELKEMISELKVERPEELPGMIFPWKDSYLASREDEGNHLVGELDQDLKQKRVLFRRYDLPERSVYAAAACPSDEDILAIMTQVDGAPRPDNVIYDYGKKEVLAILPMTFSGTWSKHKKVFYSPKTITEADKSVTTIQKWSKDTGEVEDLLVSDDHTIFGSTAISEDGKILMISFSKDYSNDIFYAYDEESGKIEALNEGEMAEMHYVDSKDGHHYFIRIDKNPHGTLIAIPFGQKLKDAVTVYEEKEGYMDFGWNINGSIYLHITSLAASSLMKLDDGTYITLPDKIGALSYCGEGKNRKFFAFDSFTAPLSLCSFDGKQFLSFNSEKPCDELEVELDYAPSYDDKQLIPYYLVHRKDAKKDESHQALMYGYGGYNLAMPPWSVERISQINIRKWVSEGGIYVHCLLRGGNEYGSLWHENGMKLKKKNCFYDFIGIAEKVMADKWTVPSRTVISGCSNGGLLMSALVTMRPDLWGCVIDSVPHTDMIHFADDDRGPMYVTEYGDPYNSKEEFEYLLSYSPVHNVKDVEYPAVYVQTGECDNNVPPYHGKSFAAMMQEHNTSDNPILLRVLKLGAHDRGQGDDFWKTIAEMRLFIRKNLK